MKQEKSLLQNDHPGQGIPKGSMAAQLTETFEETLKRVSSFGIQPGLEVIGHLMAALGDPQKQLPVIHVAGTNGKGSVCAMLEAIFRAAGYKTGLYTSPHLISYGERFRISGQSADQACLESLLAKVIPAAQQVKAELDCGPTEFEILTAMAFLYFYQEKVDILILETGLGGRLDATNLVERPLMTVITNVTKDHENFLGNTVEAIAGEKAGIIKPGADLVCAALDPRAQAVIGKTFAARQTGCDQRPGQLHWVWQECSWQILEERLTGQRVALATPKETFDELELPLAGEHQCANLAAAVLSAQLLEPAFPLVDGAAIARGVGQVLWPCRLEQVGQDPVIILDGAHNPDGMQKLARWLQKHRQSFPKVILVMGMLKDKDRRQAAQKLESLVDRIIITRPPSERALDWEEMAKEFSHIEPQKITLMEDGAQALQLARGMADPQDLILVTGSLYLVGSLRAFFE